MGSSVDCLSQMIKVKIEIYEESVMNAMSNGDHDLAETLMRDFDSFMADDLNLFDKLTGINVNNFCQEAISA